MVIVCSAVISAPVSPAYSDTSEIADAQARANKAARELSDAESELGAMQDRYDGLTARRSTLATKQSTLAAAAKKVMIYRYANGKGDPFDADITRQLRIDTMVDVALGNTKDSVEGYAASLQDMAAVSKDLGSAAKSKDQLVAQYAAKRRALEHDLAVLEEIEARNQVLAQARREAQARLNGGSGGSATPIATGDWVCPVQGAHSFVDDFAAPRPGGRLHHGVDIMAAEGTLIVAPVSGTVSFAEESLGGRTFWEYGDDGLVYYGAHLEKYGYSGHVEAGVVVGTVGITGDASAYHLHFQIGSNGGGWYNPYATLLQYC